MKKSRLLWLFIFVAFLLVGCQQQPLNENSQSSSAPQAQVTSAQATNAPQSSATVTSTQATETQANKGNEQTPLPLKVHFIDVGQGDSILVTTGNSAMLIDAGENSKGETVVSYLKSIGITKLDYVVGTHPHSDHIGGLDNVINSFEIGNVIMPKVSHTTATYKDVLMAIKKKNLTVTGAKAGQVYNLGNAKIEILSPIKDKYEGLNEYSVVIRLSYGDTSFLFTGDMEEYNENELLKAQAKVSADMLKVAHHGSSTSTTEGFLKAVAPKYAFIPVGKDNKYGHPHKEVYSRLEKTAKIYRSDKHGTVVATSDGKNIAIATERE